MDYRRVYVPGGTYFFTIVTFQRRLLFASPKAVEILRNAFRHTMVRHPFTIVASVILPDHMHFIWTLPSNTSDFSVRWRLVKSHFTRDWNKENTENKVALSRPRGEGDVWQNSFWEHLIRDEVDLSNYIEYIHYNPIKHGLVKSPVDWEYSSFMKYVQEGYYPVDWGGDDQLFQDKRWME